MCNLINTHTHTVTGPQNVSVFSKGSSERIGFKDESPKFIWFRWESPKCFVVRSHQNVLIFVKDQTKVFGLYKRFAKCRDLSKVIPGTY